MAISSELTLPGPITGGGGGRVRYTPLGGDGFVSPRTMVDFSINRAGDATGGNNTVTVFMDTNYIGVISLLRVFTPTDPADFAIGIGPNGSASNSYAWNRSVVTNPIGSPSVILVPPALLMEEEQPGGPKPFTNAVTPNVTGVTFELRGQVFLFDRFARDKVPLEVIYSSVVRGGQIFVDGVSGT